MTNKKDIADDDLKGFEELLQDNKDQKFMQAPQKNKKQKEAESGLELITFLEEESIRLDKLVDFFDHKIDKSFAQTQQLVENQKAQNAKIRESILEILSQNQSPLLKSLGEIFDHHFKNIQD